ncbi:MAG TPA: RluA family pseudouridine synthase [Stellaceae bacterium]|jgi:23S rRNA pseudouridine955/2504/2580 synthase
MSGVQTLTVAPEDAEIRLDRWFKRHFPTLGHGRLEKLLRTGQIRLDGKRVDAGDRVTTGQRIRVPPLPAAPPPDARPHTLPPPTTADARLLQERVLYRDDELIVIDKPEGLAVQGGTGTSRHLDGLLDALRFDAKERPRLVHRLDKDTSGVLVLARSARAAARLGEVFRRKIAGKVYWAITVGAPKPRQGKIDQPLAKQAGPAGERVAADDEEGDRALTYYRTVARAADRFAWLALEPVTGRTHQLRVHCLALGTPILGDGKYGAAAAHPASLPQAKKLHLHARAIALPLASGKILTVTAPLPPHMRTSWEFFGFEEASERDPFAGLVPSGHKAAR